MEDIKIEKLSHERYEEVVNLLKETYKKSFNNYYPNAFIDFTVRRQTIENIKMKAKHNFYVLLHEKKVVACGCVITAKDCGEIVSFCVHPSFQKRGLGKLLLQYLEQIAQNEKIKRITCFSSIIALPFYVKNAYNFKDDKMIFSEKFGSFHLEKTLK